MAILEEVKTSLRITHSLLDGEITSEIAACKTDLSMAGVSLVDDTDALTVRAITLYCRGMHDYAGKGDKSTEAYEKLKISMALSGFYNEVAADV